jgi:hypothetical protein
MRALGAATAHSAAVRAAAAARPSLIDDDMELPDAMWPQHSAVAALAAVDDQATESDEGSAPPARPVLSALPDALKQQQQSSHEHMKAPAAPAAAVQVVTPSAHDEQLGSPGRTSGGNLSTDVDMADAEPNGIVSSSGTAPASTSPRSLPSAAAAKAVAIDIALDPSGLPSRFRVSDVVECINRTGEFAAADVVSVSEDGFSRIGVHFHGRSRRFDIILQLPADLQRLRPLGAGLALTQAEQQRKQQDSAFRSLLYVQHGLEIVACAKDGNCLFRAVSHQLTGSPGQHKQLRAQCCDQLLAGRARFAEFVHKEDPADTADGHFADYVANMRRDAVWADNVEIAALREALGRDIQIFTYSAVESLFVVKELIPDAAQKQHRLPPLRLSYHGGNHYNSVVDPKQPPTPDNVTPVALTHSSVGSPAAATSPVDVAVSSAASPTPSDTARRAPMAVDSQLAASGESQTSSGSEDSAPSPLPADADPAATQSPEAAMDVCAADAEPLCSPRCSSVGHDSPAHSTPTADAKRPHQDAYAAAAAGDCSNSDTASVASAGDRLAGDLADQVQYVVDMSDHIVRMGPGFDPNFPGALTPDWPPPAYRRQAPIALLWLFDEESRIERNDAQDLSMWQRDLPLLPVWTSSVPHRGWAVYTGVMADTAGVGRRKLSEQLWNDVVGEDVPRNAFGVPSPAHINRATDQFHPASALHTYRQCTNATASVHELILCCCLCPLNVVCLQIQSWLRFTPVAVATRSRSAQRRCCSAWRCR